MPGPATPRPTVTRAERSRRTHELLLAAHATDDLEQRARMLDEVILLNQCVAEAIAYRYRGRGVPLSDLQQSGFEGLVKAVQKFDPTVRPDLLTYAVPTIRGEIQRWFRDQSWIIRPPRRLQELQWKVSRGVAHLEQELGREPSDEEVRAHVDCTARELDETFQSYGCFSPASLDATLGSSGSVTLGDLVPAESAHDQSAAEVRAVLAPLLRRLGERDRRIIHLRFIEDQSQAEIGAEFGISQMQVSRLLARILRDLQTGLSGRSAQTTRRKDSRCTSTPSLAPSAVPR
jgi:RNA polymerase sigma-B factor